MVHLHDAAPTPPEWLLGPTATAASLMVLIYILLNLAIVAVGVDKVEAWRSEMQARLETEQSRLFQKAREVEQSPAASAPAAAPTKARKKRPRRGKRVRAPWSVFFLGTAEEAEQQDEVGSGAFDLDDQSWCEVMSAHAAPEEPADHHFIGDATPVATARQDVYDLGDDAWCLASHV